MGNVMCLSGSIEDKINLARDENVRFTPEERIDTGLALLLTYDMPRSGRGLTTDEKQERFKGLSKQPDPKVKAERKQEVRQRLPDLLNRFNSLPPYNPVPQTFGGNGDNKVLVLLASPSSDSISVAIVDAFINEYNAIAPDDRIYVLDLFRANLPQFDELAVNARNSQITQEQVPWEVREVWRNIEVVVKEFRAADKVVIACPMWNFGIPYKLKQYIDVVTQPNYLFKFTTKGYKPLKKGGSAYVVYTRGCTYADKPFLEHQEEYLETWLPFVGYDNIYKTVCEPTDMGEFRFTVQYDEAQKQAVEVARAMAREEYQQ